MNNNRPTKNGLLHSKQSLKGDDEVVLVTGTNDVSPYDKEFLLFNLDNKERWEEIGRCRAEPVANKIEKRHTKASPLQTQDKRNIGVMTIKRRKEGGSRDSARTSDGGKKQNQSSDILVIKDDKAEKKKRFEIWQRISWQGACHRCKYSSPGK